MIGVWEGITVCTVEEYASTRDLSSAALTASKANRKLIDWRILYPKHEVYKWVPHSTQLDKG